MRTAPIGWLPSAPNWRQPAGAVASCSALRRRYRDQLRLSVPGLCFVHLHGSRALLSERLLQRKGHYMPASLLDSQLQTLETPGADEHALHLDINDTPQALAYQAAQALEQASS
jgi:gluconokinase